MSKSSWVRDVDEAGFAAEVIEASRERPVLVDFWAAWCGPCRMLSPVLERLAAELDGAFVLAKVDTETNQSLAARFQIRGIPACKLFSGGEVVDEFVGALPEPAVREFLGRHIKSDLDLAIAASAEARRAGEADKAAVICEPLLGDHPDHPAVLIEAARVALALGDADAAVERAGAVSLGTDEFDTAQTLLSAAELARACNAAGGLDGARSADDAYALGACQAIAGDYRAALETLLQIVRKDERAQRAMVAIFTLCDDPDLARTYRRKLAIAT